MKPFSKAIGRIGTENAFAVGPEIAAWVKKGYDIVKLTVGEPGANIPRAATKAAIDSLKKHQTHYTPSVGLESLRKKIARYSLFKEDSFIFTTDKDIRNYVKRRNKS